MKIFYVVEIKSDEYRPKFQKFESDTVETALLYWLSTKHEKKFDGVNHAKDFLEALSLELTLYPERELYSVYNKTYQAGISDSLETIIAWLAE